MLKIAYQGCKGSFGYLTAQKYYGSDALYIAGNTFADVFDLVYEADYGVVPLENSLAGSVYENYDLLQRYTLQIVGETYTRVELCLLGTQSSEVHRIKKVVSHPKALEQCRKFLSERPYIETIAGTNTALAAKHVSMANDPTLAAIASREAGDDNGLKTLASSIEDDPMNYTRFVFLSADQHKHISEINKCSLAFTLPHQPDALRKVLKIFSDNGANLSKIESRPLKGTLFEYQFYADLEFKQSGEENIKSILRSLDQQVNKCKFLGKYTRGER